MLDNGKSCKTIIKNILIKHHHLCCDHHQPIILVRTEATWQKWTHWHRLILIPCSWEIRTIVLKGQFLILDNFEFWPWTIDPAQNFSCTDKTASKKMSKYESANHAFLKVDKWCWKSWNGLFVMHIYDKPCEIMQKINGRAQTANFSVLSRLRQELCAENPQNMENKAK